MAVRDGAAGAGDRPSLGQAGHAGGALWGQQPAGIAAAGAEQIASTGDVATRGRSPVTSARARIDRIWKACRRGIGHTEWKIRARGATRTVRIRGPQPDRRGF